MRYFRMLINNCSARSPITILGDYTLITFYLLPMWLIPLIPFALNCLAIVQPNVIFVMTHGSWLELVRFEFSLNDTGYNTLKTYAENQQKQMLWLLHLAILSLLLINSSLSCIMHRIKNEKKSIYFSNYFWSAFFSCFSENFVRVKRRAVGAMKFNQKETHYQFHHQNQFYCFFTLLQTLLQFINFHVGRWSICLISSPVFPFFAN